jgi:ADP-ribose pyrophosphatase
MAAPNNKTRPAGSTKSTEPITSKPRAKAQRSKLLSSKRAYKGRVFDVYTDTVQEPNGLVLKRDVIRHNGSVVILAIDESKNAADPEVILERQYRHAVGDFLLELPAGRVEPGESLLAAAKREMIEETGYRAKKWTPLARYFASPGFLGEWMQIYLARDIREGAAKPEADEQIETLRIPLSEALKLVRMNKIHDGKSLIGLLMLDSARREGKLQAHQQPES